MFEPTTLGSLTVVALLFRALDRVDTQAIFDRDGYESRRKAMPGSRLLKSLALYQLLKTKSQRGLVRASEESKDIQQALGGQLARNTLSNAIAQRDLGQVIEAWMLILQHYGPSIGKAGKKFARIASVDASLIKLSLQAFNWAKYREKTGAAKITCILDWSKGVPSQFVFTAAGKVHDLAATVALEWSAGWTYLFDRGYFSFDLLATLINAGAHFVIRFKEGVSFRVIYRNRIPEVALPAGIKELITDWTIVLPGLDGELLLRLVTYNLTDGKRIRVLTDRFDLTALSIARLYKERWTIETWWKWLKQVYKVKEPLGVSENALPVQIVAAFVIDLLLRAFKHCGGFKGGLYEFIDTCRDMLLSPLDRLGDLRETIITVALLLGLHQAVSTSEA